MYTLIGHPTTRAFRVLWMLEEIGAEYDIVPARPRTKDARKHNPTGKVPALLVDGDVIIDSVAICQFLADKHGLLTFPAGSISRAKQDSWTQFAMDDVELPLWVNAKHDFILPEELRSETAQKAAKYEFDRALKAMADRLGQSQYVMGNEFTVPDLLLGHCGMWAVNGAKWTIPEGPVAEYFSRVIDRPAWKRAFEIRSSQK